VGRLFKSPQVLTIKFISEYYFNFGEKTPNISQMNLAIAFLSFGEH